MPDRNQWVFPDPVFGPTVFAGLEKDLIETAEVNRLLYVKQLSTVYLFYPPADYSRFEHSLGMASLVRQFAVDSLEIKKVGIDDLTNLVCAAIVHDIGHAGWAHAGELFTKYLGRNIEHDDLSMRLVLGDPTVMQYFPRSKSNPRLPLVSEVLKGPARKNQIANLIKGDPPTIPAQWTPLDEERIKLARTYLGHIISSPYIDLDRVSYLIRDAFYTAGAASFFSLKDVLERLNVRELPEGSIDLMFGSIPFAESFILTRDLMSALIYEDPRNLIAEEMLARAFYLCYKGTEDLMEIWFKTDHEMWEDMRHHSDSEPIAGRIAIYIRDRKVYKKLYQESFRPLIDVSGEEPVAKLKRLSADKPQILEKERELAPKGVAPGQLILCIHMPDVQSLLDITLSPVWLEERQEAVYARDVSPLIESMDSPEHHNHRSFVQIAVDPEVSDRDQQEILANFKAWLGI